MTTTNNATEQLITVQVSSDYPSSLSPRGGMGNGVFFAKRNGDYFLLIVPASDPRSAGMWYAAHDATLLGLDNPEQYRGWNVESRFVSVVEDSAPETESPREVNDARDLRKGDVFQISSTETQYVVTGDRSEDGNILPIQWGEGLTNTLADWRGPSTPSVRVNLVPESAQSDWARAKSAEVRGESNDSPATPESGDSVTLTADELARRLEEARLEGKREADATFEAWKESANATAIEYANENSLCSEFDRCMRDIGMMDREEWRESHSQEFTVEFTYSTTVSAYDSDEAIERAQEEFEGEQWRGDWSVV